MQNQMLVEHLSNSKHFSPMVFPLMWEQGLDAQHLNVPIHPIRIYKSFPHEFNKVTGSILWDRLQNLVKSRSIRPNLAAADIILTDLHSAALIGAYYKQALGKKLVIRFGGNVFRQGENRHDIEDKYHWFKGLFFQIPAQYSFNRADKIIVNGQDLHDELTREKFPHEKIHIIPVGLSPDIFYPPPQSQDNLPVSQEKTLRLLFYGRITEANGPLQLLDIIRQVSKTATQPVTTTVIGDGPLLQEMQERAQQQQLAITFTPRQPHRKLAHLIRQHHFCVFPFRKIGGISSVVTESMACGRVVFAANSGDVRNVIHDRVNGFLSPIDQPQKMAETITQVAINQPLQKTIRTNAIETVHEKYIWPSVMEKYSTVFKELVRI